MTLITAEEEGEEGDKREREGRGGSIRVEQPKTNANHETTDSWLDL